MKINRKEFLHLGALSAAASLLIASDHHPQPTEETVYLPIVKRERCAMVKLAEHVVPRPAGFAPGFSFLDLGNYKKYIVECTANPANAANWHPTIMLNEDAQNNYKQIATIYHESKLVVENETYDSITFPVCAFPENSTYWFKVEIDSVIDFNHVYMASGIAWSEQMGMLSWDIKGIYQSYDVIDRIDLAANFPPGLFGPGTVVRLYGVI